MPIITIAHQLGSGGREIGQMVAKKLNLLFIDRQVIQEVANELGISEAEAQDLHEKADNVINQVFSLFRFNLTGPLTSTKPTQQVETITYQEATKVVLERIAANNDLVIVGHGANFYLAGRPNVLSVFIYAPASHRINVLMERDHISQAEATRQIQQNDAARAHYIRSFYGADWRDPDEYHLMLNTAIYPPDSAADLVVQATQHCLEPLPKPAKESLETGD